MTIERLEEIAAWAEKYVSLCKQYGTTEDRANYADLARCARAWATVERLKPERLCFSQRKSYWTIDRGATCHDTALEAVEGSK